jgi:hypothetical protein
LRDSVTWKIDFFIPFESKKIEFWQKILKENNNINVIFYNGATIEGVSGISFFIFNKKLGMPRSHNILGNALMMMIWKGYKEIGLLGVDHSWLNTIHVTENNDALLYQKHFYENSKNVKADIMRKKGIGQRRLHEIIFKFYLSFRAYFDINDYAIKKGVKITNLTKDSYIDAFDRNELSNYLK